MVRLSEEIIQFFSKQKFVIVSTIDKDGTLHTSCKGIVRIDKMGLVYLLDLYLAQTYNNLKRNPQISLTAVDEHHFRGYCLKGKARLLAIDKPKPSYIDIWEKKIASRITQRLLKNMLGEKGHPHHPEAHLPEPKYLIVVEVKKIIDLTPRHIQ